MSDEINRDAPIIRAHITNPKDMADMLLSLDRLQDGEYARKWHGFPTTKEDLQAVLKEIRVDGVKHGEYYINIYESSIPGLVEHLPIGADIDEINYLAVKLKGMNSLEIEKFCAAMEYSVFREGLTDIINTAENLDCFDLQPAFSEAEYGEFLADMEYDRFETQINTLKESRNPANQELAAYIELLEKYFSTEAYGNEYAKEEGGRFTQYGYLTKQRALEETYTGLNDIPPEYRVFAYPDAAPEIKPSVMDKLAAAKEAVGKIHSEKPDLSPKSHNAEL